MRRRVALKVIKQGMDTKQVVARTLRGQRSEALRYLRDVVEHGFSDAKWMLEDSDLTSLRGDPEFEKIVAAAKANQERAARMQQPLHRLPRGQASGRVQDL